MSINYVNCALLLMDNNNKRKNACSLRETQNSRGAAFLASLRKAAPHQSRIASNRKVNVERGVSLARNPFKLPSAYLLYC